MTKATMMFFRAEVLIERQTSQKPVPTANKSWRSWLSSKKILADGNDADVTNVVEELSKRNLDPERLQEVFREVVTTTSGVEMSLVKASLCRCLASTTNVRKSVDQVLDFLLTMEDVEDGELFSDSDDEEEGGELIKGLTSLVPG